MESNTDTTESEASIDELDEMLIDLRHLDEVNDGEFRDSDYSETPSVDSDQRRLIIRRNRVRLGPFYANRKDILTHFLKKLLDSIVIL